MKAPDGITGFGVIEIIVAISILVVLAGIVFPVVSQQVDEKQTGKILSLVDTLKGACEKYRVDTGDYPREYSDQEESATEYHQLSTGQKEQPDWQGPYLNHPLTDQDNPFKGYVYLYPDLRGGEVKPNGFDLTGSGSVTHKGRGNFVGLTRVSERVAMIIDETLDNGIPGDWMETGRVEYSRAKRTLAIYLIGGSD